MGMPIPEVRERLEKIAYELRNPVLFPRSLIDLGNEIAHLAKATWRTPAVTKAPVQSRKMTKRLADEIIAFHAEHPDWTQQQIGEHFNVISGRVSEALNGKWRR
jgi:hypothetical protein